MIGIQETHKTQEDRIASNALDACMYMYVSQYLCLQLGYITNDSRVGRTSRKAVHVQELHTLHSNGRARASLGLRLEYCFGVTVWF